MPIRPLVLFMVPERYTAAYAALMTKLTSEALETAEMEPDAIELLGFVSPTPEYGQSCLHFLGSNGADPQSALVLVLWGETGDQFNFDSSLSDSYVFGSIVIPSSYTSIPVLCVPSMTTGWLQDEYHWASVRDRFADLMKNGRKELTGTEPYMFITRSGANWN